MSARNKGRRPPRIVAPPHGAAIWLVLGASLKEHADLAKIKYTEQSPDRRTTAQRYPASREDEHGSRQV